MPVCREEHPPMVELAAGHRVACWATAAPAIPAVAS
jgi:hypothetical protein